MFSLNDIKWRGKPVMQNSFFRILAPRMVPTVAAFPTTGTNVTSRFRRRRSQNGTKWEKYTLERMSRTISWLSENYSWKLGMSPEDYRRVVVQSRRGKKKCVDCEMLYFISDDDYFRRLF
jgi:hypothetical protein